MLQSVMVSLSFQQSLWNGDVKLYIIPIIFTVRTDWRVKTSIYWAYTVSRTIKHIITTLVSCHVPLLQIVGLIYRFSDLFLVVKFLFYISPQCAWKYQSLIMIDVWKLSLVITYKILIILPINGLICFFTHHL